MSTSAIFCLATSRGRADRTIHELKCAAFLPTEIGVLFFDRNIPNDTERDRDDRTTMSAAATQSAGPIRGVLSWVAGVSRLVVPGVGAFIAAGPIIATLRQARSSSPGVAIAQSLISLGMAATEATRIEQRVKFDGHFLISVHSPDATRISQAREIFAASSAEGICTAAESASASIGSPA